MFGFRKTGARFARDASGSGAVEFALVFPVLLAIYFGGVDVTRAIVFHQRLQQATVMVNDLVAQAATLTKDIVTEQFKAADVAMTGYDMKAFKIKVTNVEIDASGKGKVLWSVAKNTAADSASAAYKMPSELSLLRDTTVVVTQASDSYAALTASVIAETIPMSAISVGRSRSRKNIVCSDCK